MSKIEINVRFYLGDRGDLVGEVVSVPRDSNVPRKIVLLERGHRGVLPKVGEEWVCEFLRDTQPGARKGAIIVRPVRTAAADKAAKTVADLAMSGEEYRERARKFLADRFLCGEAPVAIAADGTVVETDYTCGGGFWGALAVLPRPADAPPRGAVKVAPGDTIVRHHFESGKVTAIKVVGKGVAATGGAFYDKGGDDWQHVVSYTAVATGEETAVPADAPGWVRPAGKFFGWDPPEPNGDRLGTCESGAVIAILDRSGRVIRVAGLALDVYGRHGAISQELSCEMASSIWGELLDPKVGPWTLEETGAWVRRSGGFAIAAVRPRGRGNQVEILSAKVPSPVSLNVGSLAEAMVVVDFANGWETRI